MFKVMNSLAVMYGRTMKIRGMDFGHVLNASGARGFFGEGYWFHGPWKKLGLDYKGSTLVAKTTTLAARDGNMPLQQTDEAWKPKELIPKCIVVKPWKGVVLNSVGLSGPGIVKLLPGWAKLSKIYPLMVSVMSVEKTASGRIEELRRMSAYLRTRDLPRQLAIQVNLSCPNAGIDPATLESEALESIRVVAATGHPVLAKINAIFPVEIAEALCRNKECDGLVVSNTIPWGKLGDRIDWKGLFGSSTSPLESIGGGGLSGKPLLPIVRDWIKQARAAGISKPIVGGGGILSCKDADVLLDAGATAIELGSVSILRPWRVGGIIRHVNKRCSNG